MSNAFITIASLIEQIEIFRNERDWKQFHSGKNMAISLSLEAAELLEIFQWKKNDELLTPEEVSRLSDELADVLYWTLVISNDFGINLTDAFLAKMEKNKEKYPVETAKGSSKKYKDL